VRIEDAYDYAGDDAYKHPKIQSAKEGVASSCWRRQEFSSLEIALCVEWMDEPDTHCTQSSCSMTGDLALCPQSGADGR
jgi:hypothetical protein